jgi:hypothetical protein
MFNALEKTAQAGHAARMGEMRNIHTTWVGKPEGRKKPLRRSRRRREDNIKMYLGKMVFEGVNKIHLAQDRDPWRIL